MDRLPRCKLIALPQTTNPSRREMTTVPLILRLYR